MKITSTLRIIAISIGITTPLLSHSAGCSNPANQPAAPDSATFSGSVDDVPTKKSAVVEIYTEQNGSLSEAASKALREAAKTGRQIRLIGPSPQGAIVNGDLGDCGTLVSAFVSFASLPRVEIVGEPAILAPETYTSLAGPGIDAVAQKTDLSTPNPLKIYSKAERCENLRQQCVDDATVVRDRDFDACAKMESSYKSAVAITAMKMTCNRGVMAAFQYTRDVTCVLKKTDCMNSSGH